MFMVGLYILLGTSLFNWFIYQWARSAGPGALGLLPLFITLPFLYTIGVTVCICSFF